MKTIQELRDELNHKVRTLADLKEKVEKRGDAMSPEEQSETVSLFKDIDDLKKDIKTIEDHEERMAKMDSVIKESKAPELRKTTPTQPGTQVQSETRIEVPSHMVRYGKLKAFKNERDAYISGQWFRATFLGDYRAMRWCQDNGVTTRAQSEGINTAGGALVPDQLSTAIIDLREVFGVFRRECGVVPMGSDSMAIPRRTSGLTAYFTAEGTAITESEKSWNQVNLIAKKLAVLTRMSTELSDDAIINVADDLASEIAYAMANKEDLSGFNGDASQTYGGITGITVKALLAAYAGSVFTAAAGHDTFAELDHADITGLMGLLPQYALPGAKFYCSQLAWAVVFGRLNAIAGGNNTQTLQGMVGPNYLGYPVVVSQVLPAGPTTDYTGLWMLGFGNLGMACSFGERRGVTIKRSDERYFAEDQIALKGTERIDINVHDLGTATTAGPFVSLVGGT